MYARIIRQNYSQPWIDSPGRCCVNGAARPAKSTLIQNLGRGRLTTPSTTGCAGAVQGLIPSVSSNALKKGRVLSSNEVQRASWGVLAIKTRVDRDRTLAFLLTGSANVLLLPQICRLSSLGVWRC